MDTAQKNTTDLRLTPGESEIFRKKERLLVADWSEKNIIVTDGPMRGPWRNEVTSYTIGPQNAWNLPHVRKIFLCWAPQTAKTRIAFNCMAYAVAHEARSVMYCGPDEKVLKRISKRRILPMFKQSPRLASLMSPRADDTTITSMRFVNGADLMLVWATSAAELGSESIPVLIKDEVDKYPEFSGKEADPGSLGEIRTTAFPYTSKILELSTPNLETGIVADIDSEADMVYRYGAQCPVCNDFQIMEFEKIVWPKDKRDPREIFRNKLAHYSCGVCGMLWDDYARNTAVLNGLKNPDSFYGWMPDKLIERPSAVAFHLPSWYSPFVSLSRVAMIFLRGQDDPKKLMVFITQHKAEAWRETIIAKKESSVLANKTELPSCIVPEWAIALTAGIDTQKRGFWFVIRAWGADMNSHLVHHGYLTTLSDVETLIYETKYPIDGTERTMGIWRATIDTGGGETESGELSRTEEIYAWIKRQNDRQISLGRPFAVFGTKGATHTRSMNLKRIKISRIETFPRSNKPIPGGLEIRLLDTAQYKELIHWRLERNEGDSQRFFLNSETGEDYARQILAEELRKDRRGKAYWKQVRRDNHLLDCEVGAAACADREWLPSLQMLVQYLLQEKAATEKTTKETAPKTPVARSKWMTKIDNTR